MKVKQSFPLFLLLAAAIFFQSCKKDDACQNRGGDYSKGIFVVNEGGFGGTGTVTWHNPETGETMQDIFGAENNCAALGQFVQSLSFHNGKGYIVVNAANKIVVVDARSFRLLDTIGGLSSPRFFMPANDDYAYVSQWGADGLSGSLAKINLSTNKVEKTIPVGSGPEKMLLSANDILYVANSGGFGIDSNVTVFRLFADTLVAKLKTGAANPACLARANNTLFALCKGYYNDSNPLDGWLGDVGPNTIGFNVEKYADDLVASPNGETLYFIAGSGIWMYKNHAISKLADQPAYGLTCHPTTGNLYCADGKDFNSAGKVYVFKPDGTKIDSFSTGISPGEIVIVQ